MTGKLTKAAETVLAMRSERDKIGVPVDRTRVPPDLLAGFYECLRKNWLIWIDQEVHPACGFQAMDVYLLTPSGRSLNQSHDTIEGK